MQFRAMRQKLLKTTELRLAHEEAHGREGIRVSHRALRAGFPRERQFKNAPQNSHRRETLPLRSARMRRLLCHPRPPQRPQEETLERTGNQKEEERLQN